ncbi:MAG: GNAT family N-acetyltransferase [Candidatus Delongbacteria bacterium]|nr:GNAT family N-acetyltransferase [Candidatus Delongbacteria bacterium]
MHDDYKIKTASPDDIHKIARVHVDCWRTTYKDIVPDEKLQSMSYEKSAERWKVFFTGTEDKISTILLLDRNEEFVGFCAGGRIRKMSERTAGYDGEIKAIYILKEHQRMGLGKKLISSFEEIFQKNGIFSYIIWVLKDNSSKEFYKKLGGKLLTTKTYEIGGKKLKGLCFGYKIVS